MKIFKNKKSGFSIGEVILAVFILGVTLTTIMSLYITGLKELMDERDNVIASLLAQEGVELVRNIRDNNWVNDNDSFEDVDENTGCAMDMNSNSCDSTNFSLNYNGAYYVVGSGSKFSRKIIIEDPGSDPEERTVLCLVSWNSSTPLDEKDKCTASGKCVFSEASLSEWGNPDLP